MKMIKANMKTLPTDGYCIKRVDYYYILCHINDSTPFLARRNHVREFKTIEAVMSLLYEFEVVKVELYL